MMPTVGSAASWNLDNGVKIDWTNSVRYNAAFRMKDRDRGLIANPAVNRNSPNLDDGDQNFDKGLISNRIELFTELDAVSAGGWGGRVSALAFYDTVYNRSNDNPGFAGGAFPNHTSRAANEFTDRTRDQLGRDAEIRDAFLFGSFDLGGRPGSVRVGQYALVWGESLFFANNAIAGAQNPFDVTRLLGDPTAEAKEFVLPVPQLSAQWQVTDGVTVAGYYQFRHRRNRIPAVGSYFSVSDTVGQGAERLLLGPGVSAPRESEMEADDSGQFGLQLRWRMAETDFGLYALRFHDKDFQQVTRLGFMPGVGVLPTSYYLTYPEDTKLYGFSASRSFGDVNLAVEASIRKDQALASSHAADSSGLPFPGMPAASDNDGNPAYAVGDTAHINLSTIWSMPRTPLWNEANFIGEVAWTRLLKCRKNCSSPAPGQPAARDPNATRDSVSLRAVLEPTYRQVVSGLDISVPVGVGYTPKGSRNILGPFSNPPEDGGDVTVGVTGLYMNAWEINLAYTHYFGTADRLVDNNTDFTYQQSRRDRDFLSFTVRYSF
jgi:hypothetical protein